MREEFEDIDNFMDHAYDESAVVPMDQAIKEVEKWMDGKRISKRERDRNTIERIAGAISSGDLVIHEDGRLTQTLLFPVENSEGEITATKLEYKARLSYKDAKPYLQGINQANGLEFINAYATALTKQPRRVIEELDAVDMKVVRAIVGFFL